MASDQSIELGMHVVGLAYRGGHSSVDDLWQHPGNASLREARPDPGVLAVGDVVHVPDAAPRVFANLATRREHALVVELPIPQLRVVLQRPDGTPYAGVQCTVTVDGTMQRLPSDAHGCLEFEIGPETVSVALQFDLEQLEIRVAHLMPVDTLAGGCARLDNLGYRPGAMHDGAPHNEAALRCAVEEFQCDHGLVIDGELGAATQAALLTAHGA